MPPPEPVELQAVLGILRLARKYDVPYLYRRALRHLAVPYSNSSFGDYQNPVLLESHIVSDLRHSLRALTIIMTATEVGELWLLPIVHYLASAYTSDELLWTIPRGPDEQIVQRCIAAHVDLVRGTGAANSFLAVESGPSCTLPQHCNTIRSIYLSESLLLSTRSKARLVTS
ncbi:hypothetical protein B0H10DRAFT_1132062 [Mycena sp. CBHHK59/15]|nr:hypothetical protein B0H10DRAFT_1132062 [Mycena sp. CBHHK59/15]